MIMRINSIILIAILALAGCATNPVTTDYDPNFNFVGLKTYDWVDNSERAVKDPLVENDLMQARIERSVDQRLSSLGFSRKEGSTDFLINYHVKAEDKLDIDTFHSYYGYYPCWDCFGPRRFGGGYRDDIWVTQYKQGVFMLDVISPATEKLVWRGIVERRLVASSTPQQRDAYVDKVVEQILSAFPPGRTQTK